MPNGALTGRCGMLLQVAERAPLTALLTWAWMAFTIEADNAVEVTGSEHVSRLFRLSMAMWANGLRFIDEDGISVDELRSLTRANCNIPGLERWKWISVGDVSGHRREGYGSSRGLKGGSVLRPTRAGSYARRLWPQIIASVEERWRERFGRHEIDSLHEALLPPKVALPWAPPEVHPSDGFRTHLNVGPPTDEQPSFAALMGQTLTGLTLAQEEEAEVSVPLGANFLRVIGTGSVRTRDLPSAAGVSKEAVAMAIGFLQRGHLAEKQAGGLIKLTATGLDALNGYRVRADNVEDERLREALTAVVSQRSALAEGLVPPAGCWRGEKPYLAQTSRLLADPIAALPWHPMVLHRGGWPDGS